MQECEKFLQIMGMMRKRLKQIKAMAQIYALWIDKERID